MRLARCTLRTPVAPGLDVKYVDSRSLEDLRAHYPELRDHHLISPDIIDEAETLATIADGSQSWPLDAK